MHDYTSYLLRTERQISELRARYAGYIAGQGDAFAKWIAGFPPLQWVDFLSGVPEKNIPIIIGTVCILYIDRRIDIDFNESATRIRRWWTPEEEKLIWKSYRPKKKNNKF